MRRWRRTSCRIRIICGRARLNSTVICSDTSWIQRNVNTIPASCHGCHFAWWQLMLVLQFVYISYMSLPASSCLWKCQLLFEIQFCTVSKSQCGFCRYRTGRTEEEITGGGHVPIWIFFLLHHQTTLVLYKLGPIGCKNGMKFLNVQKMRPAPWKCRIVNPRLAKQLNIQTYQVGALKSEDVSHICNIYLFAYADQFRQTYLIKIFESVGVYFNAGNYVGRQLCRRINVFHQKTIFLNHIFWLMINKNKTPA